MKDKLGNEYARLSELQSGDKVKVDGDFTCIEADTTHEVYYERGFYIKCNEGRHYLASQLCLENDDSLIGVYLV